MLLGMDNLTILRGSKFYGTWVWENSDSGEKEDLSGLTATIKIKNIHEEFEDIQNVLEVGTATVEPLDSDGNTLTGRIDIELSKTDTLNFMIPSDERDRYGESDYYSVLTILLSTGEVALQAKVKVVESLESETLDYLVDNRGEAIIINSKLDDILARNDEYISTRDNLIDIVIPTAITTYDDNHDAKLAEYNNNHTLKMAIIDPLVESVSNDKLEVEADKQEVKDDKQEVKDDLDSIGALKTAIELSEANIANSITTNQILVDTATSKAEEASASEVVAKTKAEEASASAEAALISAQNAHSSEDDAQTSAQTATEAALAASNSAISANTSEDSAKNQAGIATTKADEALVSANNASTSETNSENSAIASSDSAANSENQAIVATTQAEEASASANEAEESATSARASAAASANSAKAGLMSQILYITGA